MIPRINLILGDALTELNRLIEKKTKIDLIYIDPPYEYTNSGIHGKSNSTKFMKSISNLHNATIKPMKNGIDYKAFGQAFKQLQPGYTNVMIWCNKNQIRDYMKIWPGINPYILFWGKTNPTPLSGRGYLPDVEYILHFKKRGRPLKITYEIGSRFDIQPKNIKDKKTYDHPTIKPLNIVERHIKAASHKGDLVLDCFMGTATTGLACKKLERNFIGIECEKKYWKIALNRIEEEQ